MTPEMPALAKILMDQDITVVNTFVQVSEKRGPRERRLLRSQTAPATAAAAEEVEEQFEGEGCEGYESDLVAQEKSEKSVIEDCFGSASPKPRFWHSATPDRWEWDAMLQDLQEEGMSGPNHDGFIRQSSEKSVIEDCQEPEPSETMRMKLQSLRTQNVFDTPDVWELQAICESFGESPPEPALPLMDQDITVVNTFVQGLEKQRLRERRLLRSQTSPATAAAAEEVEGYESDLVAQEKSENSVIEDCFGSASPKPRFWHSATPDRWEWDAMLQDLQEEGMSGPNHDGFIRQSSEKSVIEDCQEPEPSETMRMKLQSLRTQNVFDTPDVWELQAICESFGESPAEPALPLMDQDITAVNTFVQGLEKQRLRERRLLRSQTSPATAAAAEASSKPRFWHSATPDRWEWDAMLQDLQEEGMSGPNHDGFIRQSSEKSVIEDCQEPEPSETMRMKLQSLRTQNVFDTPDVWELQAICESFGESPPEPALPSATSVASLVRSSTPDPWEWDAMLQDDKLCVPQPCMAPASLMPSGAPLGPQSEYPRPLGSPERKPSMRPGMLETSFSEGQTLVKWCVDASKFSSNSGRLVSPDFQLHFPQQEPLTFRLMVIGGKNAGFKKAKGRGSLELKCFSAVPPGLQSITACVAIGAGESQRISPKPIKHNFVEKTCCQLRNGEEASWDFKKLTGDATICEIAVEIHL